ncbi:hypothetical protein L228DRAFT_35427 [Xylona heveae TC161]|uniref:Uncharacterized protein n=1 Tax=Xylona heveae (strain CBS 132557 / TC161) TaxID=1328760 RepID=A0A165A8C9_XYLHT|nr:hypothetical protein L228DRAFT_35427 [Xylona heveae TC161]KZF20091.1 hypothetical protein L228DRAFT_35427 [Xylona heveae TC161]
MTEPEDLDEDLFADLYDGEDVPSKPTQQAPRPIEPEPELPSTGPLPVNLAHESKQEPVQPEQFGRPDDSEPSHSGQFEGSGELGQAEASRAPAAEHPPSHGPGIKEDG